MSKATAQDLIDAGFRAEQFGTPADFPAYLAPLLVDATTWVSDAIGADVYASAGSSGIIALRIKRAELCYARAELWRRRAAFLDGNAFSAMEGNPSAARERESYLTHASEADSCAQFNVDLVNTGGDSQAIGSGVTMGYAETGPFAVDA